MKVAVEVITCFLLFHIFVLDLVDGESDVAGTDSSSKGDKKGCRKDGEKGGGRRCKAMKDGRSKGRKSVAPYWRRGQPQEAEVVTREGDDVTLNCAVKGRPTPDFSWLRNGKSLNTRSSQKYRQKRSKLFIKTVNRLEEDDVSYTCIAKNKLGHLNHTFVLRVLENVLVTDFDVEDRPENQTAHVGDTVTFKCKSRDYPQPRVHWVRKTDSHLLIEMLTQDSNTSDTLVLHNVSRTDSGTYTCYVTNDMVSQKLSARLTVIERDEALPHEPRCSLHARRERFVDHETGCRSQDLLDMDYCGGSCGRSYYIPHVIMSEPGDGTSAVLVQDFDSFTVPGAWVNLPSKCCVGVVKSINVIQLQCPLGRTRQAWYTRLRACECRACGLACDAHHGPCPHGMECKAKAAQCHSPPCYGAWKCEPTRPSNITQDHP